MPEKLRITELDFESIKANLKNYLRNQSTFKDYDFDGSSLSILLDLLAYNTHYNAYYMNMVANEMFLDTAIVRQSVLSHAKALNYTPSSSRGAIATIRVVVTPPGNSVQSSLTLERFQTFQSEQIDGFNYTFATLEAKTAIKENGVFTFNNVQIKQGTPQTYRQVYNNITNPQREFFLPDTSIDTTTLKVLVQESSVNTATKTFIQSSDATIANSFSRVYFVDTAINNLYKIRFGDGSIGAALSNGNIIISSYLATDGERANRANSFSTGAVDDINTVTISPVLAASGGAGQEGLTSIKYRAPLAYTAQNRLVTPLDYETLILNKYPAFRSLSVWGGQEETPPVYGKVFLSYLLQDNISINETEKQRIIDEIILPNSIVAVTPQFIDPDYLYLIFDINVRYSAALTTQSAAQLEFLTRAAIENYMSTGFNRFGGQLVRSRLERTIDDTSTAFTGSHAAITLQKRFAPNLGLVKTYIINFGFPINRGGLNNSLASTGLYVNDPAGVLRLVFLDEVPNSFTGVDNILIDNPGFHYTDTPTVTITGDGAGATAVATIVNERVTEIKILTRGSGYTRAVVVISGGDGYSATATAVIVARYGTIRTYYFNDLAQKVVVSDNIGTVDHQLGRVTLTNLNILASDAIDGYVRINVESEEGIITAVRNQILLLDTTDPKSLRINVSVNT